MPVINIDIKAQFLAFEFVEKRRKSWMVIKKSMLEIEEGLSA
jgi:hypothetical protein